MLVSGVETDRLLEAARRLSTTPGADVVIPRADVGGWLTTLVQHAEQLPFGSPIVGLDLADEVAARVLAPKEHQQKVTATDYVSVWICTDDTYYEQARARALSLARYLIDVLHHAEQGTKAWQTQQQLSPIALAQVDWLSVAADLVGDPQDWQAAITEMGGNDSSG